MPKDHTCTLKILKSTSEFGALWKQQNNRQVLTMSVFIMLKLDAIQRKKKKAKFKSRLYDLGSYETKSLISSFYFDPFCPLDENCFEKGRCFRCFQSQLHSFSDLAPVVWNQLPGSVHHSAPVSSVKSSLETFLFLKTSVRSFKSSLKTSF